MEGARKFLVDKINEVANLGGDPQPKGESIGMSSYWENFTNSSTSFDNFWAFIVDKLNQILPSPETLRLWIHVGLTRVLPIALILLLLCCCCCCAGPLFALLGRCLLLPFLVLGQLLAFLGRCLLLPFLVLGQLLVFLGRCFLLPFRALGKLLASLSSGAGKMMKAPGRGGARMPRALFEGNPRGYFGDLRANKPLVY